MIGPASLRRLVAWYRKSARDLPWRSNRDPYLIWISEVLSQQTQVETVRPFFARFVEAFPTVHALADASIDRVLKAWEGCGYYARARNLHRAAQQIVRNGGELPGSARELRELPGIGPYTSAAIASIAYGEAVPVLDGNVERVLIRVLCERRDQKSSPVQKRLRAASAEIMASGVELGLDPGDLNQSLMELGAMICRPRSAECHRCPIRSDCRARAILSDVTVLPRRTRAKPVPHFDIGAAIIRKRSKILITQRPHRGLLGGLWEFPGGKRHDGETLADCVHREIREELGIEIAVHDLFAIVKHAYTHFRITLHCFDCRHLSGRIRNLGVADSRWISTGELDDFAFPKADRVIIAKLKDQAERL